MKNGGLYNAVATFLSQHFATITSVSQRRRQSFCGIEPAAHKKSARIVCGLCVTAYNSIGSIFADYKVCRG